MTYTKARYMLRAIGMTIRKQENEYRINFPFASEDSAYYTDDLDDAIETAKAMQFHRTKDKQNENN